jgi:hypothetical protein
LVRLNFLRHARSELEAAKLATLSSEKFQGWLIRKLGGLDEAQTERWLKSMDSLKRRHLKKEQIRRCCLEMNTLKLPSPPKQTPYRLSWADPLLITFFIETEYTTPSHSPLSRGKRLAEQNDEMFVAVPVTPTHSSCERLAGECYEQDNPSKIRRTSSC